MSAFDPFLPLGVACQRKRIGVLIMDKSSLFRVHKNPTGKICPFIFRAFGAELIAVDIGDDATSKPSSVNHSVAKSHVLVSPNHSLR